MTAPLVRLDRIGPADRRHFPANCLRRARTGVDRIHKIGNLDRDLTLRHALAHQDFTLLGLEVKESLDLVLVVAAHVCSLTCLACEPRGELAVISLQTVEEGIVKIDMGKQFV